MHITLKWNNIYIYIKHLNRGHHQDLLLAHSEQILLHHALKFSWYRTNAIQSVDASRLSTDGSRTFPAAASQTWSSLPEDVTSASTVRSFQQRLKTHLFRQSFSVLHHFYWTLQWYVTLGTLNSFDWLIDCILVFSQHSLLIMPCHAHTAVQCVCFLTYWSLSVECIASGHPCHIKSSQTWGSSSKVIIWA